MQFPEGNQLWKQRAKHGRDLLFATPVLMWEAAMEYFDWCDNNPWIKTEFNGKDAVECEVPTSRPYTLSGLCIYLDCDRSYFLKFKANKANQDFFIVITRIEEIIYTQKFEGAAVGAFNANIIARDLGLIERKNVEVNDSRDVRVGRDEAGNIVISEEADDAENDAG